MTLSSALVDYYNDRIQLNPSQIELIAAAIRSRAPNCRLLVFGLGNDTAMWQSINSDGYTLFVEDSRQWIEKCRASMPNLEVVEVSYGDRTVGSSLPIDISSLELHPIPSKLKESVWDVIFVDSPTGYDVSCSGRSLTIWWASQLMRRHTHVFIDDHQRTLEAKYTEAFIAPKATAAVTLQRSGGELFWAIGESKGFLGFQSTDHSGRSTRTKYLLSTEKLRILLFHDSVDAFPSMVQEGLLDHKSIIYFSFSWYRSADAVRHIRRVLAEAQPLTQLVLADRVFFLANSKQELATFKDILPEYQSLLVNNAALLNPALFGISQDDRDHHAVLNAKAVAFKRHELAAEVEDRLFVSYTVKEVNAGRTKSVDLSALNPKSVICDIQATQLAKVLGRAQVGLALSEEEGACYASLEYLLCGLPVVSTPSRGGRDEFYSSENSITVAPNPDSVAEGVRRAIQDLHQGKFNRERIRQLALQKRGEFLEAWSAHMEPHLRAAGVTLPARHLIEDAILQGNKLSKHKNFWVREVAGS